MASGGRPPALRSFLGHVVHERADVANPYLLRVCARAWEDLGEDQPSSEPPAAAAQKHEIISKFYDTFSGAGNVDYGRPLASVNDPKVFRIRAGGWRAAVRYTPEDGVVWLCRALSLADFHDETDAYDEFGRLFDREFLLAQILGDDEPIMPAYNGLPAGTNRQANEIPYVQAIIELRDEREAEEQY